MLKRVVVATAGVSLVLASCGSSATDSAPDDSDTLPDAEQLIEDAEAQGISPLALAFDEAANATSFRAELAMGMSMELGAAGSLEFAADPATPMALVEVDADGEQYTRIDLAPMMNGVLAASGLGDSTDAGALLGGDLSMEMWLEESTMTVDVSGFAPILQQNLGASNVFPAEIFTVDVGRFAEGMGASEAAAALSGQAAPDPVRMAGVLRDALGDAEAADDGHYAGVLTLAEYSQAFGQDPEMMLGSMGTAADFAGVGVDELRSLFDEVTVATDVTLADGAVDTIRFDIDFAPLLGVLGSQFGEVLPPDSAFTMTMLMDYEIDPTVDVVVPAGDFPDGTDQYLDLVALG